MSKKWIILIVIIIVITITAFSLLFISKKKKQDRDYELMEENQHFYYPLEIDGKYGVIKKDGTVIIDAQYDDVQIPNSDKDIFIVKNGEKTTVLNERKEKLYGDFEEVSGIGGASQTGEKIYNNTVLKYKDNGKYGIVGFDEKKITDPIYESVESLTDKYGEILVKKDGKYGVINVKGIQLVECQYDYIKGDGYFKDSSYKHGGYIVGNKASFGINYGYIDRNAKEIIKIGQESIYRVTEIDSDDIYLVARENGRYALYKGKENLTDYRYIEMYYNNGTGTFTVQKNKSYGLINTDGKVIIPEQYEELMVVGIYAKASKAGIDFTFDLNGNKIENSEFVSLQLTSTDKYYISINSEYKYGIANLDKEKIIDNIYDYIEEIPTTGLLIATKGKDVTIYSAGIKELVSVENADLKKVGDYIQISSSEETYFLTADGKKVDNKTVYLDNQLFASKKNEKWGFVDLKDNVIIDYEYDEVTEINEYGFAGVKKNGKWGVIDKNGNLILEPTYQSDEISPVFLGKYYLRNGVAHNGIEVSF